MVTDLIEQSRCTGCRPDNGFARRPETAPEQSR
jgi:hypothetical protein